MAKKSSRGKKSLKTRKRNVFSRRNVPLRRSHTAEEQSMKIFILIAISIALIVFASLLLFVQDDREAAVAGEAVSYVEGECASGEMCFYADGSYISEVDASVGDTISFDIIANLDSVEENLFSHEFSLSYDHSVFSFEEYYFSFGYDYSGDSSDSDAVLDSASMGLGGGFYNFELDETWGTVLFQAALDMINGVSVDTDGKYDIITLSFDVLEDAEEDIYYFNLDSGSVSTYSGGEEISSVNSLIINVYNDGDGDGYDSSVDCDDSDASVNPGATEVCDAVDNNCDGDIDEDDATDVSTWYADLDGDLYGDASSSINSCEMPDGYVSDSSDCDDNDVSVNPGAEEVCSDEIDNDCDGEVDESFTIYHDGDSDGYGDSGDSVLACYLWDGYVENDEDCDDTEVTMGAEIDWYQDSDGDGYGDYLVTVKSCYQVDSYVADNTDCDDNDDSLYPLTWYADLDGDLYGDASSSINSCEMPEGYVSDSSDCDDSKGDVNPGVEGSCGDESAAGVDEGSDDEGSDDSGSSSSSSSSSGGGGGASSSYYVEKDASSEEASDDGECSESWVCGSWTECSSSQTQTRSCADEHGCGTYNLRPDETRSCDYETIAYSGETESGESSAASPTETARETVYIQEESFMEPVYNAVMLVWKDHKLSLFLSIAVIGLLIGGILLYRHIKFKKSDAVNTHELEDFVNTEREAGISEDEIRHSLAGAGWNESEINSAFTAA